VAVVIVTYTAAQGSGARWGVHPAHVLNNIVVFLTTT